MRIFKANGRTGRTYYVFPRKKKPESCLARMTYRKDSDSRERIMGEGMDSSQTASAQAVPG